MPSHLHGTQHVFKEAQVFFLVFPEIFCFSNPQQIFPFILGINAFRNHVSSFCKYCKCSN